MKKKKKNKNEREMLGIQRDRPCSFLAWGAQQSALHLNLCVGPIAAHAHIYKSFVKMTGARPS
jgi:hypothetical protein